MYHGILCTQASAVLIVTVAHREKIVNALVGLNVTLVKTYLPIFINPWIYTNIYFKYHHI